MSIMTKVKIYKPAKTSMQSGHGKTGFDYTLGSSHERRVKPRNYGDNFKYIPVEEGA